MAIAETRRKEKYVTRQDIIDILGPLDNEIIIAIQKTGATCGEILEASEWFDENYHTHSTNDRRMADSTRKVYQILDYARNVYEPE